MKKNYPSAALRIALKYKLEDKLKIVREEFDRRTAEFSLALKEGRVHGICMS